MPDFLSAADESFRNDLIEFSNTQLPLRQEESHEARKKRIQTASKAIGLFYLTQPRDYGGQPGTLLQLTLARETLAQSRLPDTAAAFGPAPGILADCGEPLLSTHLLPLLAGERSCAFAFTEPDDAPRPSWAIRDGAQLVVNGAKSYVTGGTEADFINAMIHIEEEGPAMVAIDCATKGVDITRTFSSLDGSRHAYFTFTDAHVPVSHIIGQPGEGLPRALRQIGDTRLAIAALCSGTMLWVLDYLAEHIQRPHRGGTPLADLESVRLRYAQLRIDAYAARSMLYRTARLGDAGENIVNESIATKVFTTEALGRIVEEAIQLVGGQALRTEHPLASLYTEVRSYKLTEGASDVLRLNLARGHLDLQKGRI